MGEADKPPDIHRSIKNSLESSVRATETQERILRIVSKVHRLVVHATHFLKSYILYDGETRTNSPLNVELVKATMTVLCEASRGPDAAGAPRVGRRPSEKTLLLKQELHGFHRDHYQRLMENPLEPLGFTNQDQTLQFISKEIVKDYENNIKLHFVAYVKFFVNVLFDKKARLLTLSKDDPALCRD